MNACQIQETICSRDAHRVPSVYQATQPTATFLVHHGFYWLPKHEYGYFQTRFSDGTPLGMPEWRGIKAKEALSHDAWNYFLSFNFLSDRRSDKKLIDKK